MQTIEIGDLVSVESNQKLFVGYVLAIENRSTPTGDEPCVFIKWYDSDLREWSRLSYVCLMIEYKEWKHLSCKQ